VSGPLPGVLRPLTVPVSWVYGAAVNRRNRQYDRAGDAGRVSVPVISVGNITVGGTGKSPFVAWLARLLVSRGRRPAIALRGYGARVAVAGGVGGAAEMSDEQAEYARLLPDVPLAVDPDRLGALRAFLPAHSDVDCVLLDDGFQHRRLHRDLDIVLIDATRDTLADHLLPWGRLREPLAGLSRADAIVVTRASGRDAALAAGIAAVHGKTPVAWSRHVWSRLRRFDADGENEVEAASDWLRGKRVLGVFGVGHPDSMARQVEMSGATLVERVGARDHERYTRAKVAGIVGRLRGLDAMVTTGKDWSKLRHLIDFSRLPVPVVVPEVTIDVFDGADRLAGLALDAAGGSPA